MKEQNIDWDSSLEELKEVIDHGESHIFHVSIDKFDNCTITLQVPKEAYKVSKNFVEQVFREENGTLSKTAHNALGFMIARMVILALNDIMDS